MRVLKRPMFRKGGSTSQGIMTGLVDRKQYENGTDIKELAQTYKDLLGKPDINELLISGGLNLLSGQGAGRGTLAEIASAYKQPTSTLFQDIRDRGQTATKLAIGQKQAEDVAKIKASKPFETEFRAKQLGKQYDNLIEKETDPDKIKQLQNEKLRDISNIYKNFNVSRAVGGVYSAASIERATELATEQLVFENQKNNPNYVPTLDEIQPLVARYLKQLEKSILDTGREENAMGGLSGREQDKKIPLSYDELKGRLKGQVSDNIVRLLSASYEALADFAEIRTQADVNSFNQKYQVELVLPQTQES